MSSHLPHYVECIDGLDFLKKVSAMKRRHWIYRGHGQSNFVATDSDPYLLRSSLWRYLIKHKDKIVKPSWYPRERISVQRFQQVAHLHLQHLPNTKYINDWLALMQHYGAPTRLLDFTLNPAIALFFAVRDASPNGKPWSVHALHVPSIRGRSFTIRQNADKTSIPPKWPRPDEYNIGCKPLEEKFCGVIDGRLASARKAAQEGVFLVPNRIDLDIEGWLSAITPKPSTAPYGTHWVKFIFKNSPGQYYTTVTQLMQMGMSAVRLFPGLEGICESFHHSWLDVTADLEPGEEL
jgi:hypothetical protein